MLCRTKTKSLALALVCVVVLVCAARAQTTVTLLTGETRTIDIQSISAEGEVQLDGDGATIKLADIRSIEKPAEPPPHADIASFDVLLAGGGKASATSIQLSDEAVRIVTGCGELKGTIDLLRSIQFSSDKSNTEYTTACEKPPENNDLIFVRIDNKVQSLRGFVLSINDQSLTYEWAGEEHSVARDSLFGVVFVALGGSVANDEGCTVRLADASLIVGVLVSLDGELAVKLPDNSTAKIPWQFVARVEVHSPRLAFVSDLEPAAVEQQPIVTLPQPHQRDKSVSGGPLKLGGVTYDKGLGVHSHSRLDFDIQSEYQLFVATIGIDAATNGKGDCFFVVLGDGTEVLRKRMRGSDAPKRISLDVVGVDQLTLLVEPGEALDLADHGNWCDAVLIRKE